MLELPKFADDPHLAAVGIVREVEHPTEGTYRHIREAATFEHTPTGLWRHAPTLGQHTAEVLAEIGWSASDIAALIDSGAGYGPLP